MNAVARQAFETANFWQQSTWFRTDDASCFTITLAWVIRGMQAIPALVKLVHKPTLLLLQTVSNFLDNCQFEQPGSGRVLYHEITTRCPDCHTQQHCHCCMYVTLNFTNICARSFWWWRCPGARAHLLEKHGHGSTRCAKKTLAHIACIYEFELSLNDLPIQQIVFISFCPFSIKQIHGWPWIETLFMSSACPASFAAVILFWPPTFWNIASALWHFERHYTLHPIKPGQLVGNILVSGLVFQAASFFFLWGAGVTEQSEEPDHELTIHPSEESEQPSKLLMLALSSVLPGIMHESLPNLI